MELGNYLTILFMTAFDFNIFYFAGTNLFEKRRMNIYLKCILAIILYSVGAFVIIKSSSILFKYVVSTLLLFGFMNVFFKGKKILLLLTTIALYALFTVVDGVLLVFINTDKTIYELITKELYRLFGLSILSRLICLLIVVFVTRNKKHKIDLKSNQLIKFIILLLFTMAGVVAGIIPENIHFVPAKILIPLIFTVNILFVYYIFNDFIEMSSLLRTKSINEERTVGELKLWEELKEKDSTHSKIIHDYTNHLLCIKGLLDDDNVEELKEYIDNIAREYKIANKFVSTDNVLLDVLINNKYEKALKKDISMILRLDKLDDIMVAKEDLVVLLSNLIDNALEACEKLKHSKKEIYLSVKQTDILQIIIRNPIEQEVEVADGIIRTTKIGSNHGIGLINIKDIIDKYHGKGVIDVDEGYFTYLIEI